MFYIKIVGIKMTKNKELNQSKAKLDLIELNCKETIKQKRSRNKTKKKY